MSKKKSAKQMQKQLSPEEYIRKKSRNLPIVKCLINEEWETSGASIVVVREHVGGTITICFYFADLFCLGLKDTGFYFSVSPKKLDDLLQKQTLSYVEISYELAHNIIYSAIEYAEEYGFVPCDEFIRTTSFFLEEDTDDIPLISVKCGGEDGNPLYISVESDSPDHVKKIMAQLDSTAGKGNYNYILNTDGVSDEFDFKNEIRDNPIVKKILDMDQENRKKLFSELLHKTDIEEAQYGDNDNWSQLLFLIHILSKDLIDENKIHFYKNILRKELYFKPVDIEKLPNSFFDGVQETNGKVLCDLFDKVIIAIVDNKNVKESLNEFQSKTGNAPIIAYLKILDLETNSKEIKYEQLKEYYQQYPNYFLIRAKWLNAQILQELNAETRKKYVHEMRNLIQESRLITEYEYGIFLSLYITVCLINVQNSNLDFYMQMIALEEYIEEELVMWLNEELLRNYKVILTLAKVMTLDKHLKN